MESEECIAVALSGGMDSLYALLSLLRSGRKVIGIHGLFQENRQTCGLVDKLRKVCENLGVEFHVAHHEKQFEQEVIIPFCRSYQHAATPNPCVLCNRGIKFGALMDAAFQLGASFFATGHYCRLLPNPYAAGAKYLLAPPDDLQKNQRYFLGLMEPERLARVVFPLNSIKKTQIRDFFARHPDLLPEKRESRDLCFTDGLKYGEFLSARGIKCGPGPIYLKSGDDSPPTPVGRHKGLDKYTIGQRKRLGVAWSEALYVVSMDMAANSLFVATARDAFCDYLEAEPASLHVPFELWPEKLYAQTRYRGKAACCVVKRDKNLHCYFHERQSPAAAGQAVVFYDANGLLLGGGFIKG